MNSTKDRDFQVLIYESEYRQIQAWVDKYQHLETGGDLFGLWVDDHTAVVQLVLGPGKNCRRTSVSFYQDVEYLDRVGNQLTHNEGLCHIGEWHSHHRLGLSRPSGGDKNTVWTNMDRYGISRFFLFIATIEENFFYERGKNSLSYDVKVSSFLFETSTERRKGVLEGNFEFIGMKNPQSPFRKKVKEQLAIGAESQNSANELLRFKQSEFYIIINSKSAYKKPKEDTKKDSNPIIEDKPLMGTTHSYTRNKREMPSTEKTSDQQNIKKPRQMEITSDSFKKNQKGMSYTQERQDQQELSNIQKTRYQQDMEKAKRLVITTDSNERDQGDNTDTKPGRVRNQALTTEINNNDGNKQQNKPSSSESDDSNLTTNVEMPNDNVLDHITADTRNRSMNYSVQEIQQKKVVTKVVAKELITVICIRQQDNENDSKDNIECKTGRVRNTASTTEIENNEVNKEKNKSSSSQSDERYVTPNADIQKDNVLDDSTANNRSTKYSAEKIQQSKMVVVVSGNIEDEKYTYNENRPENNGNQNKTDNQFQSIMLDIVDTRNSNGVQGDKRGAQKDISTKEATARHVELKDKETQEEKHHESYVVQGTEESTDKEIPAEKPKVIYVGSEDRGNNMNTNQPTRQKPQDPREVTRIRENTIRDPQQKNEDKNTKDVEEEFEYVEDETNPNTVNFPSDQSDAKDNGCFGSLFGTKKGKRKNKKRKQEKQEKQQDKKQEKEKKRKEKQEKKQKKKQEKKEKKQKKEKQKKRKAGKETKGKSSKKSKEKKTTT